MLYDTHCHLNLGAYDEDLDEVIAKAHEDKVLVNVVGVDLPSSEKAIKLADKHAGLWATVGHHPSEDPTTFDYQKFLKLAKTSKKVVGIGECGLDYHYLDTAIDNTATMQGQKDMFLGHIDLAHELNLPLVIHCRDAHSDMIEILMHRYTTPSAHGEKDKSREFGVMHCFTGNWREAQAYLDLGFLISLPGIITFTKDYDEVVTNLPLDKMLIETDAPWLTPAPHRGQRNLPQYVEYTARHIAHLRGISFEEVAEATTANGKRLFGI